MNPHVIQFGRLEAFVAELSPSNLVRVVILDSSKSISSQIPDFRHVSTGVHVRTINEGGHILACYLPVATTELFNGRREGDPTWEQYDKTWQKAEALKDRLVAYLQKTATEKGFTVSTA
ncbi:MAG: hypothetical protein GY805_14140, partial [Chloroflexi bacterium]|nr:hypothetical protein [Chloroflexota bacterium]